MLQTCLFAKSITLSKLRLVCYFSEIIDDLMSSLNKYHVIQSLRMSALRMLNRHSHQQKKLQMIQIKNDFATLQKQKRRKSFHDVEVDSASIESRYSIVLQDVRSSRLDLVF